MYKQYTKNHITFQWDTENLPDITVVKNAVYYLLFPNGSFYIGSCRNLMDRLFHHCTDWHASNHKHYAVYQAMSKYRFFSVKLVKTYASIEEARIGEQNLIRHYSHKIYNRLSPYYCASKPKQVINTCLLNEVLYSENHECAY